MRFKSFFLIILCILMIQTSACSFENKSKNSPTEATEAPIDINLSSDKMQDKRMKSGTTDSVPWESDAQFQAAQKNNNTYVSLAAYSTVLHDPLPGEEDNVHLAAQKIAGTVVKPGGVFSQNAKAGPYNSARGYKKGPTYVGSKLKTTIGGGVCKVASTIYNVAVLSNLNIVERHAHGMPVPYVPYGQDATVSYGSKDIKFKNNTSSPILIWAQGVDNILYIAFYSQEKGPQVEWHHDIQKVYKAGKVYKITDSLPKSKEKVVAEGMDGAVVKSWVIINDNGTKTTKAMRSSYYSPFPSIIEKGK